MKRDAWRVEGTDSPAHASERDRVRSTSRNRFTRWDLHIRPAVEVLRLGFATAALHHGSRTTHLVSRFTFHVFPHHE